MEEELDFNRQSEATTSNVFPRNDSVWELKRKNSFNVISEADQAGDDPLNTRRSSVLSKDSVRKR